MKNLKFLFVAVVLTCFVGVTQTKAQAVAEWLEGVKVGLNTDGVDGWEYLFYSNKHRVETSNGIINYVAWGDAEDIRDGDMLEPGEYIYRGEDWRMKITVYPDYTFEAVYHSKVNKKTPVGKNK